ncbi:MAG: DUF1569 domain-containing protein [Bacteroidota bacterium]
MTTARSFIQNEIPKALDLIDENSPAKFGIMTPQHMVEHLGALFYLGRKEVGLPCITPDEKLPEMQAWLDTDEPFWREFQAVGVPKNGLMDLRFPNLDEAKSRLISARDAFYKFHNENPEAKILHPVFGKIGLEAWERFHYKHCIHHLQQFGGIPEDYTIKAKA